MARCHTLEIVDLINGSAIEGSSPKQKHKKTRLNRKLFFARAKRANW
jgi:hypothetical protein